MEKEVIEQCPEALMFYLGVFDLNIMCSIIFVFKQESSEKRFFFFFRLPTFAIMLRLRLINTKKRQSTQWLPLGFLKHNIKK
jgi:hypothetical protein